MPQKPAETSNQLLLKHKKLLALNMLVANNRIPKEI
jgi:hypothetical protein